MRIIVNGRNVEITDAIKAYVKEKIGKVANHYDQIQMIEVVLTVIKNPSVSGKHTAEAICKLASGASIIAEETAESMYASIDILADKLNRQVIKYKDKNLKSKSKSASIRTNITESNEKEEDIEETVPDEEEDIAAEA